MSVVTFLTTQSNQAFSAQGGSSTFQTLNFVNSNGVSFSNSNGSIIASAAGGGGGGNITISAGTSSGSISSLVFSNSNGLSFGLNGNTLTATVKTDYQSSGNYLTTAMQSNAGSNFVNASAGLNLTNVSATLGSNSISISVAPQTNSSATISAGTKSETISNLVFSNSNGVSFGLSNGTVTATVKTDYQSSGPYLTTAMQSNATTISNINVSAGTTSQNLSNLVFSNSNNFSFGLSGSTITASYTSPTVTNSSWTVSDNATSGTVAKLAFTNLNGVTLSLSTGAGGSHTIVGSVVTTYLTSQSNQAFSASGGSSAFQTLNFANSNGVTFSNSNGSVIASYTVPTVTNSSFSVQDSATTINPVARIAFSTGNNITLSLSTGASSATVGVQHNLAGTSTGFGGNLISASMTHNSSGLNLSLNHPAWLTTADLSQNSSKYVQNWKLTGNTSGTTSSAQGTDLWLAGGNGVTISGSSNTLSFSVATNYQSQGAYLTTAANSTQTLAFVPGTSGNTSGTLATIQSGTIALVGGNNITISQSSGTNSTNINIVGPTLTQYFSNTGTTFNGANISGSLTFNTSGLQMSLSVAAPGGGGGAAISAGANSQNTGTVNFANSNGVTFGLSNNGTMTASVAAVTNSSLTVQAGTQTLSSVSRIAFVDSNGIFFGASTSNNGSITITAQYTVPTQSNQAVNLYVLGNTTVNSSQNFTLPDFISFRAAGLVTMGFNNNSFYVSGPPSSSFRASNDAIGLNTAQSNVTWTVNSSGLSLDARGYAGTGTTFAGTGISASATLNSVGLNFALSGGTVNQTGPNIAAGTQTATSGTIVFSNSNGLSFGMSNSSVVTASYGGGLSIGMSTNGNTSGTTGTFLDTGNQYIFAGGNNITLNQSNNANSVTLSINGLSFSNSNGITFGINNGTLTADARNILSTYEPYPAVGLSTTLVGIPTATSAGVSLFPFVIDEWVSAGVMNMAFSLSFVTNGTSSGQQTCGLAVGLYSRNGSTLSSIASTSLSYGITGNNSTYSINQVTATNYTGFGATAQTSSAGVNITSGYTGMKLLGFPINSLLTPGNYWLGIIGTNSTSSVNVGLSMSYMGAAMGTFGSALAPVGSFSSAFSTGQDPKGGRWNIGQGSWTSAGSVTMIPASMNFASISAVAQTYPLIKFWST